MKGLRVLPVLLSIFILTTLASCGSNGGTTVAGGGVGGTGISSGPISGFGSVFVNSVEFSTTGAEITKEGNPSDQSELRVGMIVTVQGSFDENGTTGTASKIDFLDNLEGPVQIIGNGALLVLWQSVTVNAGTKYEGVNGFGDLQTGNVIEVSGFPQTDGSMLASYIELKSASYNPGDEIEVKGTISHLDTNVSTFKIGDLVIDYSSATLKDLPGGALTNGISVEAKSLSDVSGGVLTATEIEGLESGISASAGSRVELEGFVTQFVSATDFGVNGQPVSTTMATQYEHGSSSNLAQGIRVEVEGTLDTAGTLIARKISFENEDGSDSSDD